MQHPIFIIFFLALSLILLPVLGIPTPASPLGLDPALEPTPNTTPTTTEITSLEKFNSSCDIICQTDTIIFQYSLAEFLFARNNSQPPNLNWSSDGCTSAPDFPQGINFQDSCYRHDFGYRNYAIQARLHLAGSRKKIDKNFKRDCYDECRRNHLEVAVPFQWLECRRFAQIYYLAVRIFAKGKAKPRLGGSKKLNGTEKVV